MKPIRVRTSMAGILRSKATMSCLVFLCFMGAILGLLLWSMPETGTMRTLYTVAAFAPGLGIVAAVMSWIVMAIQRRKPVAIIGRLVDIRHSRARFATEHLTRIVLVNTRPQRSAILLPDHIVQGLDAGTIQPHQLEMYTFCFPQHPSPQPFELVDELRARYPHIQVQRSDAIPSPPRTGK